MVGSVHHFVAWAGSQAHLLLPLGIALWIAWGDVRTYRIPNYLTLGAAAAGLIFQTLMHGPSGLGSGALGLLTGFFLLFPFYLWFHLGAGDVKALAALGAWLGPRLTLVLFCYMAIAGGLMALAVLLYKRLLWLKIRQGWQYLVSWLLFRPAGVSVGVPQAEVQGLPYGLALALGMAILFWRGG